MSLITRFNGAFKAFASEATGTFRTVFGGTTQSNDLTDNLTSDFKKGWEIVGTNDEPTIEDFNAMGYTLSQVLAYIHQVGIIEWSGTDGVVGGQDYYAGKSFVGYGGDIYVALLNSGGSIEARIPTNVTYWKKLGDVVNAVLLTGNQTIAGVKTFSSNIIGNITGNSGTATKLQTARTITLSGDVSGSVSIDGSTDATLSAQVVEDSHFHSTSTITGLGTAATRNVGYAVNEVLPGQPDSIELGRSRSGDRTSLIDFISAGEPNTVDFNARIMREPGVDGVLSIINTGTGGIAFNSSPIVPTPTAGTQAANKAYVDTKQANLGFIPVQQGTGIGQSYNVVKIGWSSESRVKVTVDSTDMGNIVMDSNIGVANSPLVKTALNASGEAPIYACRAWVNFNGTDTVAIRASGNVSSITDNGVGDYTLNFIVAMPDANYAVVTSYALDNLGGSNDNDGECSPFDYTTSSVKVQTNNGSAAKKDSQFVNIAVFR